MLCERESNEKNHGTARDPEFAVGREFAVNTFIRLGGEYEVLDSGMGFIADLLTGESGPRYNEIAVPPGRGPCSEEWLLRPVRVAWR